MKKKKALTSLSDLNILLPEEAIAPAGNPISDALAKELLQQEREKRQDEEIDRQDQMTNTKIQEILGWAK